MKDQGLEVYMAKQHLVLLAFESTSMRERVALLLTQQMSAARSVPLLCFTD